jgi:hypothetical protein
VAKPKAGGFSEQLGLGSLPLEKAAKESSQEPEATPARRCLVQRPVYFVRAVLRKARWRYPKIHKLLLGVLLASCKIRHYFESHRIMIVTSYSLGRVLHNHSATGRIAEWAMELSSFELHFTRTDAIKR